MGVPANSASRANAPACFQHLLVPLDVDMPAPRALDEAIAIARLVGGSLRVLTVFDECRYLGGFEPARALIEEIVPQARGRAQQALEQACARAQAAGVPAVPVLREGGADDIAPIVAAEACEDTTDLVVIGTHARRGLDRLLLGSVAEAVLRRAPVSVLIVKEAGAHASGA